MNQTLYHVSEND